MFKFVKPAIKLLDHTPVNGKGREANPQRSKYFLKFEYPSNLSALFKYLTINLSCTNPVVLDFNFLASITTKIQGKPLPNTDIINVLSGDKFLPAHKRLLRAKGIAIFPSKSGQIATKRIASHTQEEKEFVKEEINEFIWYFILLDFKL